MTSFKEQHNIIVVGLMTRKNDLYFEVLETTLNLDRFIDFMDHIVAQIVKKTIIKEWIKNDVWIYFLSPYSPELNLIEILWRRIKYHWQSFDAYLCYQNLKEYLSFVLNNFGNIYDIKFSQHLLKQSNELST